MSVFPSQTNFVTGDILTATAVNEIGQAINLLDGAQFAAGKNKIINGDFGINQRNFTSTTTTATYGFDRWIYQASGATATYSAQTFSLGAAPVAGYEGTNFARLAVTTGNDFARLVQYIESVRTFAGQTVTVSFWAKGTNPTTAGNLKVDFSQQFGVGGSPSGSVLVGEQTFVLTANWVRYSFVFNVPSIAGKTLGTSNDNLEFRIGQGSSTSADAWTLDLWGVQVEAASTASPFQTATGTKQGELAACQRYYWRASGDAVNPYAIFALSGYMTSTTAGSANASFPVQMRTTPHSVDFSNIGVQNTAGAIANITAVALVNQSSPLMAAVNLTTGVTTAALGFRILGNNSASAYFGFSAEL